MTYTYDGVTPNETIYGTDYTITPVIPYPTNLQYTVGGLSGFKLPAGSTAKSYYQKGVTPSLATVGKAVGNRFSNYSIPSVTSNGTYMPTSPTLNMLGEPYEIGQGTFKGMYFGDGFMGRVADKATTVGQYMSGFRDRTDDTTLGKLGWLAVDKAKNALGIAKQNFENDVVKPVQGSWGALSFNEKANTVLGTVNSYMHWRNAKKQLDAYNRGLNHSIAMDNKNYEMARKQWNSALEERARYKEAMARDQGRDVTTVNEYMAKYGA